MKVPLVSVVFHVVEQAYEFRWLQNAEMLVQNILFELR